ncbi:hypothetical protein AHiyo8_11130 [Arthrobacter sp. Hiyo8]|nr:hypothetical protein AHiyo8_11130 [Arthrobacter sp. Hiyo8]
MTTAVADRTLNALDRCDRCGPRHMSALYSSPPAVSCSSAATTHVQ